MKKKIRVALGLSGGVDSAVSAYLLKKQGFDVSCIYLNCFDSDIPGCRGDNDRKDALAVALKLGIAFQVLDFKKEYKQRVVEYFYDEYRAGRTPNPDVMCNKEIKFGLFYDWAMKNEFDYVATGHYARIEDGKLLRGVDEKKDQSYFLYRLRPEQLEHVLFPIGDLAKQQVREEARKRNLQVADKPDSQGICFIGDVNVQDFLRERLPEKKGEVIDTIGNVIGEHDGVWFYTIGQRHGFRVDPKIVSASPMYVIGKNAQTNVLTVGFGAETYRDQFTITDINWLSRIRSNLLVRIRHGGKLINAKLRIKNEELIVELEEPQRGVAAGQSAVFYVGDTVIGGGVIQ